MDESSFMRSKTSHSSPLLSNAQSLHTPSNRNLQNYHTTHLNESADLHAPDVCIPNIANGLGWVEKFVERMHTDPFVAHYIRKPIKSEIHGWGNRLESYFWPTPLDGPSVTTAAFSSHIDIPNQKPTLRLLGPFAKSSRCCSWMGIDARL